MDSFVLVSFYGAFLKVIPSIIACFEPFGYKSFLLSKLMKVCFIGIHRAITLLKAVEHLLVQLHQSCHLGRCFRGIGSWALSQALQLGPMQQGCGVCFSSMQLFILRQLVSKLTLFHQDTSQTPGLFLYEMIQAT